MNHKKKLFLGLSLLTSTLVSAETASLNADFHLNIPRIHFQLGAQSQYFWAELDYQEQADMPLTFVVQQYGLIDPETLPPALYPLSTVTDGEPPVILDIQATEARLHFISSIPLACSVIYGLSPEFGSIATDSAMSGGAIIDHNPILSNLEPDSTYYYRVQGADAAGKVYWSATNTFSTSDASAQASNLLSLDSGASVVAVSSNYGSASNSGTWGANSAIDGSSATAWSSAGDGDNAYIDVALAETKLISTIKVWSRSMSNGSAKIRSFTITTDTQEVLGPFTLADTLQAYEFNINRETSSIRFDVVESTGGNTGLIEFQAY